MVLRRSIYSWCICLAVMPVARPAEIIDPVEVPVVRRKISCTGLPSVSSRMDSARVQITPLIPPPSMDRATFLRNGFMLCLPNKADRLWSASRVMFWKFVTTSLAQTGWRGSNCFIKYENVAFLGVCLIGANPKIEALLTQPLGGKDEHWTA